MQQTVTNVLAVGVGGQGIIRLSDILADAAFGAGKDVKKSEIHGLSQRGGSVTSHIRFGNKVHAPVIMEGEAHFVLALEDLEALRYAHFVSPEGLILVNDFRIEPATVTNGLAKAPENLDERLGEYAKVKRIPATEKAKELGNMKASNTVLLGALSVHLDISDDAWDKALRAAFPEKILDLNLNAFQAGKELAK